MLGGVCVYVCCCVFGACGYMYVGVCGKVYVLVSRFVYVGIRVRVCACIYVCVCNVHVIMNMLRKVTQI